jgi:hypothetical protein
MHGAGRSYWTLKAISLFSTSQEMFGSHDTSCSICEQASRPPAASCGGIHSGRNAKLFKAVRTTPAANGFFDMKMNRWQFRVYQFTAPKITSVALIS